jgi:glyoxalase family protein
LELSGIHHVTAICGDAQKNIDFYALRLGLRLVKVTVNFDDPGSYHLYYGDERGAPGSCLTFFAWPNGSPGAPGFGQATIIRFSVPIDSLRWWAERLGLPVEDEGGSKKIKLADPDGIALELVEAIDSRGPWLGSGIGAPYVIRGFHSVGLSVGRVESSIKTLEALGFSRTAPGALQFGIGENAPGQLVDLIETGQKSLGGVGTIHHIAFATPNDETQRACSEEVAELRLHPTQVQERQYFRSIYFREPSGILYEIATSGPGFTTDEPVETLGSRLCLPSWFEKFRGEIEAALPKIVTPGGNHIPS